jgi:lipopolysaccharide transport system ATP-binding protein
MSESPIVSICIPVFNGVQYLRDCLQSAIEQTEESSEIIIADDGSNDGSQKLANNLLGDSERPFRFFQNDRLGIANNCNFLIKQSKGEFIKFLFQDDLMYPSCVSKLLQLAKENLGTNLVFSKRKVILEPSSEKGCDKIWSTSQNLHREWRNLRRVQKGETLLEDPRIIDSPWNKIGEPSTVLIRKAALQETGGFDPRYQQLLDIDLWFRLMLVGDVAFQDEYLSIFRIHEKQQTVINLRRSNTKSEEIRFLNSLLTNKFSQKIGNGFRRKVQKQMNKISGKKCLLEHKEKKCTSKEIIVSAVTKQYKQVSEHFNYRKILKILFNTKKRHRSERLKNTFTALDNVSFEVPSGDSIGIIGLNGSGKSTLLQIIAGTLKPTSGFVRSNGRIVALLVPGSGFNPEFTGLENIRINASVLGLKKAEINARMDQIINFADIGQFISKPVKTYSSGMVMRLAFSVLAHVDAETLIVDEALAVGDAKFIQKCMRFIRGFLKNNGTLILVTHDIGAVQSLCNRCIWLSEGKLKHDGPPKKVTDLYLAHVFGKNGSRQKLSEKQLGSSEEDSRDKIQVQQPKTNDAKNDFTFNPDAQGFGDGGATIEDIKLTDCASDQPIHHVRGGENVSLKIRIQLKQSIDNPVIGFIFRNRLGQDLFSENTFSKYQKKNISVQPNEVLTAEFCFQMPILPGGEYSITVAVAEADDNQFELHHWIHDAISIKSVTESWSTGLVGIPMQKIELKKNEC